MAYKGRINIKGPNHKNERVLKPLYYNAWNDKYKIKLPSFCLRGNIFNTRLINYKKTFNSLFSLHDLFRLIYDDIHKFAEIGSFGAKG